MGASVGAALGVAGATMQGLFRNPMADPGIIGVSAGGAVGAVVAIATGMAGLFFLALPTFAFVGAIASTFLVYGIAAASGRFSMATLLLAGVAVNAFLGAVVSAIIIALPGNAALREVLFWLAGWTGLPFLGAREDFHPADCRRHRRDSADVPRPESSDAGRRRGSFDGGPRGRSASDNPGGGRGWPPAQLWQSAGPSPSSAS